MDMFKAGLAVAAVFLGGTAVLLGLVLTASALSTGEISLTYGQNGDVIKETVSRAADQTRYWQYVGLLGVTPAVLGLLGVRWGLSRIRG